MANLDERIIYLQQEINTARNYLERANEKVIIAQREYSECLKELKRLQAGASSIEGLREAEGKVIASLEKLRKAQHKATEAHKTLRHLEYTEAGLSRRPQSRNPEGIVLVEAQRHEANASRADIKQLLFCREYIDDMNRQLDQIEVLDNNRIIELVDEAVLMFDRLRRIRDQRRERIETLLIELGLSRTNPEHQKLKILQDINKTDNQFEQDLNNTIDQNAVLRNRLHQLEPPPLFDAPNIQEDRLRDVRDKDAEEETKLERILQQEDNNDVVKFDAKRIEDYREQLRCSLCMGYIKNITFNCGHQVCKRCTRFLISNNPNTPRCGLCRTPIMRLTRILYSDGALESAAESAAAAADAADAAPAAATDPFYTAPLIPTQLQLASISGAQDVFTGPLEGVDIDNITNDDIKRLIECIRCHINIKDIKLNCGHQVCRQCFRELMRLPNPVCPECGERLYIGGSSSAYKKYLKYKAKYLALKNKK
jgi:hypothetical protein